MIKHPPGVNDSFSIVCVNEFLHMHLLYAQNRWVSASMAVCVCVCTCSIYIEARQEISKTCEVPFSRRLSYWPQGDGGQNKPPRWKQGHHTHTVSSPNCSANTSAHKHHVHPTKLHNIVSISLRNRRWCCETEGNIRRGERWLTVWFERLRADLRVLLIF